MNKNGCIVACDCYLYEWNWDKMKDSYICSECSEPTGSTGYNEEHGQKW